MQNATRFLFTVMIALLLGACQRESPPPATMLPVARADATGMPTAIPSATTPPLTPSAQADPTATATTSAASPSPTFETRRIYPEAGVDPSLEPPPGLLLALGSKRDGWELWVVEADGELRLLVEALAAPGYLPDFHVAPDGRQVLYEYRGDIWRLDVAAGATENVTRTAARLEAAPRWLPGDNGRFVAGSLPVAEAGPAVGYLTLIGFDGSYEVLDEQGMMFSPPAPAPDGQTIAYSLPGNPVLYHLDRGRRPLDLASFGLAWVEKIGEAAWSPDGSRLAWTFLGQPAESHQAVVTILNLETRDHQAIYSYTPAGIGGLPQAPLWGPAGDWLAFFPVADDVLGQGLWLAELEGDARRLTEQPPRLSLVDEPALAPDGCLAFSTAQGDAVGLMGVGAWEPAYWEPPATVGAVGWVSTEAAGGTAESAEATARYCPEEAPAAAAASGPLRVFFVERGNLRAWDEATGTTETVVEGGVYRLTLSPDKETVVFLRQEAPGMIDGVKQMGLWAVDAGGGNERLLVGGDTLRALGPAQLGDFEVHAVNPVHLTWLPGTQQLAFRLYPEVSALGAAVLPEIRLVDVVTGAMTVLHSTDEGESFTFAPGGERMTLAGATGIDLLGLEDGSHVEDIVTYPYIGLGHAPYRAHPIWAADGSEFSVALPVANPFDDDAEPAFTVWEVPATGGSARQLATFDGFPLPIYPNIGSAIFSPGRSQIAFYRTPARRNEGDLLLAGVEGGWQVVYDSGWGPRFLGWAPDGNHFAYTVGQGRGRLLRIGRLCRRPLLFAGPPPAGDTPVTWVDGERFLYQTQSGDAGPTTLLLGTLDGTVREIGELSEGIDSYDLKLPSASAGE